MRVWLAIPLLLIAFDAAAQAPVVLADGRAEAPGADLSGWAGRAPVQQAVAAARAYWQGQDASYEEDVRFFGLAEGAFTQPGTRQQAVLFMMSPWPRCCPKMSLALIEGDRLVHQVAFEGSAQTLTASPDLDGDGRDEMVTTGWFGMGGQESGSMTVLAFGDDGLVEWGGTSISESDCAARGESGSTAARVTAVPGPAFTVEQFSASCSDATWRAVGGPELLTLVPFTESGYVVLPVTPGGGGGENAPARDGAVRNERGALGAGDDTLATGELYDTYEVEGRGGDRLVVDLRSTAFDPYLILALPDGEQLENDDFGGDQAHSQIETTLPTTGLYRVLVTSYTAGEHGAYDLTIRVGGGE